MNREIEIKDYIRCWAHCEVQVYFKNVLCCQSAGKLEEGKNYPLWISRSDDGKYFYCSNDKRSFPIPVAIDVFGGETALAEAPDLFELAAEDAHYQMIATPFDGKVLVKDIFLKKEGIQKFMGEKYKNCLYYPCLLLGAQEMGWQIRNIGNSPIEFLSFGKNRLLGRGELQQNKGHIETPLESTPRDYGGCRVWYDGSQVRAEFSA